ncbi:MAG: family 78 glycoside hydrolase catalytic domain [Bacteroidia bacterium]
MDSPPLFSWQIAPGTLRQRAYQIQVAADPEELSGGAPLWDTGKVPSDRSHLVAYAGPKLEAATRYYWRVRIWGEGGQAGPWSQPAWWETGLMHREWPTGWIAFHHPDTTDETLYNDWTGDSLGRMRCFRLRFEVPSDTPVSLATGFLGVIGQARLFLNGRPLGGLREGPSPPVDLYLRTQVLPGANVLACYLEPGSAPHPAFVLDLDIWSEDYRHLRVGASGSWVMHEDSLPGWTGLDFQDSDWTRAVSMGSYGEAPWGALPRRTQIPRAVAMRRIFEVRTGLKQARMYLTGLGTYMATCNGQPVSDHVLAPGWTHYPRRVQYQCYDITSLLDEGANCWGVVLGNAWWSGGLGWRGRSVYDQGPLRCRGMILLEYTDGHADTIATDEHWRAAASPILYNSLYEGETYDARLETHGWDHAGFDDHAWKPVSCLSDSTPCTPTIAPPLRPISWLEPQQRQALAPDTLLFDLGLNISGVVRLSVRAPAGTRVILRFAERLGADGRLELASMRSATNTDTYICRGGEVEVWQPAFTYRGFRYVEVGGATDVHVQGVWIHADLPTAGAFGCSDPLVNEVHTLVRNSLLGNLHSVPTDCPQRDERLGWMGDAQIMAPTICYLFGAATYFDKWLQDMRDGQAALGYVTDVNPPMVVRGEGKPGWADAFVVIPWQRYRFYGDTAILERHYSALQQWIADRISRSEAGLYIFRDERGFEGFGDWVAPVETPRPLIAAAYHAYSLGLMARIAGALDKRSDADYYEARAAEACAAFHRAFYQADAGYYGNGSQTSQVLPLAFALVPDSVKSRVLSHLTSDIIARDTSLTTGFLGTGYLLNVLSEYGAHALAWSLVRQTHVPSWGYMIGQGATTLWEQWDADQRGPHLNSRNHFALGAVGEWLYAYVAGIRPDDSLPGFKRFWFAPSLPVTDSGYANYETPYGQLSTSWRRVGAVCIYYLRVPPNSQARVSPAYPYRRITIDGQRIGRRDKAPIELPAGSYTIVVER